TLALRGKSRFRPPKISCWAGEYTAGERVVPGCREQRWPSGPPPPKSQIQTPRRSAMKFRTLAIATSVFASLMGTAAMNAERLTTDRDHLNAYSTMTYRNIYMDGGDKAAVAVSGVGSSL